MNGRRTPVPPASGGPDGAGWRAFALPRAAVVLVIVAAGVALAASTSGTAAIVGWGIVAAGGTLAISFVFLAIGYSEDRARARPPHTDPGSAARSGGVHEPRRCGTSSGPGRRR